MEDISIKVHPPWYARGTPVTNTRDGPAMAISDKPLFAICRGPSARGEPKGKTRLWLTLKTTFSNTQNRVYGQWYAVLERKTVVSVLVTLTGLGKRLLILTKTCQRSQNLTTSE
jgi:hypothetical protein